MRLNRTLTALTLTVASCACGPSRGYADPVQLTSTQLNPNDITLGIVSTAQPLGYVSAGNSISFTTADTLTFSRGVGQFEVDQAGVTYGGTAFSNGTYLVGAGGFQGPGDGGAITLSFARPVTQFGLNIEDFNGGPYTVDFLALDANGQILTRTGLFDIATPAIFFASGDDPTDGTAGSLSFEGLSSTSDPIAKVIFSDTPSGSNDLIFGNIQFLPEGYVSSPAPPSPPSPIAAVTPEPGTFVLLGTGLLGVTALRRRVKSAVRQ